MGALIIVAYVLEAFLGFWGLMELVYNIRRVKATGHVFPGSGRFFLVSSVLIIGVSIFLYSQGRLPVGGLIFAIAGIFGIMSGFRADPNQ